jgi:hypothetical protein
MANKAQRWEAADVRHRVGWFVVGAVALSSVLAAGCELAEEQFQHSEEGPYLPYRYVLILDRESPDTAGMDLDAVALLSGGSTFYADDVHQYVGASGLEATHVETFNDPVQALGPPNNEQGECTPGSDTFYVNLGGAGGFIVVSFADGREILTGDIIRVYECGLPSEADVYDVMIGTETSASDPHWVACALNTSGVTECIVPELPLIPEN